MTANRRSFLTSALAGLSLATMGGTAAFAQGQPGAGNFVLIILRGAMDGLAAVVPHGDANYRSLRGEIALPEPGSAGGTLALTSGFGLHPAMSGMHSLWREGQMSFMHACATDYRERSHFDGQDVLEQGNANGSTRDGWLNRALSLGGDARGAVAIGRTVPLVLRGGASASSWAPPIAPETDQDTLARLMSLYEQDPLLGTALSRAVATDAIAGDMMSNSSEPGQAGRRNGASYSPLAQAAAQLMRAPGGPSVSVLSFEGWDTHFRQGVSDGLLAGRFRQLDQAVMALKTGLGPDWAKTTVVVTTEFGRTARVNGTGGTDHGTGGVAFVLGGALRGRLAGGQMLGDWPGLSRLYQDRDVMPANDLRGLYADALAQAWAMPVEAIRPVFA